MRNLRIGIIFFIQNRTFFSFSFSLPFECRQIETQELASDKRLFGGFDSILPSLGRAACGVMTKRDVVIKLASTFQRGEDKRFRSGRENPLSCLEPGSYPR